MQLAYRHCSVFTGEEIVKDKAVLVRDQEVEGIVDEGNIPSSYQAVDLENSLLVPAFIDLQIYGGNGKMFSHELSTESLQATYEYCLGGGCSHFMITLATNSLEIFFAGMEVVQAYWQQGGKGLLGLHLEGPYISPQKRGAHLLEYIKKPEREELDLLLQKGRDIVAMMTLAPEICDETFILRLLENNILVSAGHSNASYSQAMKAFDLGIPLATHLYNAMSPLQHREPGMVGAIFNHPRVCSSMVCDGIHVDYAAVKIAKRIMEERLFYITDAVAETTTGEYQHIFRGDRYSLPDGTLSGSALTMIDCVRNGIKYVGISLEESLRMASLYPARMLANRLKLGKIQKGYKACFAVLDESLNVKKVIGN